MKELREFIEMMDSIEAGAPAIKEDSNNMLEGRQINIKTLLAAIYTVQDVQIELATRDSYHDMKDQRLADRLERAVQKLAKIHHDITKES